MSQTISYSIDDAVFARHPAYRVAVVQASGVRNAPSQLELVDLFERTCADVRSNVDLDTLSTHEQIRPWREAFRAFGAKPSDFRPSVEALVRRAARDTLTPLGRLVDLGTVVSLRHLVPVGGHALEDVTGPIALRPATGLEIFQPVGPGAAERPVPGEMILAELDTVLTRRWVWRQAVRTAIKDETHRLFYNIDVLPESPQLDPLAIAAELAGLITEYAGGECTVSVLDAAHPNLELAL